MLSRFLRSLFTAISLSSKALSLAVRQPSSALLILRMAWWVVIVSIVLRQLPLDRALRFVSPRKVRKRAAEQRDSSPGRIADLLDALLQTDLLAFTPTCWKRAAVLHRFLALNGIETKIVFGAQVNGNGELKGHAWIEANGEPLLEKAKPDYKVTYVFPG
jgi:hypothetical protein